MQGSFSWTRTPCSRQEREVARRAGIDVLAALGVKEFRQAEDDADQIVGAALVVGLLHGRRDSCRRAG